jgi:hypothetical protein
MGFLSKLGDFVGNAFGHPTAQARMQAIANAQDLVSKIQNGRRLDEEMLLRKARQAIDEKESAARLPGLTAESTLAGQKTALQSLGIQADMSGGGAPLPAGQAGPPEPTPEMEQKAVVPGIEGGMSVMDLFRTRGAQSDREHAAEVDKHNIGKVLDKGTGAWSILPS